MKNCVHAFITLLDVSEKHVSKMRHKDFYHKCQKLETEFIQAKTDIQMILAKEVILEEEKQSLLGRLENVNGEIEKVEFDLNVMSKYLEKKNN